jgi:DNA repair photolyase
VNWNLGHHSPKEDWQPFMPLARAGIPTGVLVAPVIPGLTDHENAFDPCCRGKGRGSHRGIRFRCACHMGWLHYVEEWLALHVPLQRKKILGRIRELRGGKLNDPNFNSRMRAEVPMPTTCGDYLQSRAEKPEFHPKSRGSLLNFSASPGALN